MATPTQEQLCIKSLGSKFQLLSQSRKQGTPRQRRVAQWTTAKLKNSLWWKLPQGNLMMMVNLPKVCGRYVGDLHNINVREVKPSENTGNTFILPTYSKGFRRIFSYQYHVLVDVYERIGGLTCPLFLIVFLKLLNVEYQNSKYRDVSKT